MSKKQPLTNASKIIDRFGGIRPMAAKINTPVTTVQGWKKRDVIPGTRRTQILEAASEHSIDISDLGVSDVSNENVSKSKTSSKKQSKPKKKIASKAQKSSKTVKAPAEEKSAAVLAAPAGADTSKNVSKEKSERQEDDTATADMGTAESATVTATVHEQLISEIKRNNRKAIVSSAWIATGLILLALIAGLFLFWPNLRAGDNALNNNNQELVTTEGALENVTDTNKKFLGAAFPESLQKKIDGLQNQTRNISITVDQLSERAKEISTDALGDSAHAISERLDVVEDKIEELSDPEGSYASIVARVHDLENSVVGQEQLQNSAAQLRSMVGRTYNNLNDNLADAQSGEEGDLGRTLEGVSGQDLKAAAILIAFSQLRTSLEREEPFEEDLALLQGLVDEDNIELKENLTRLSQHADGGVLTASGLSRELKSLTGDIVVSSLKGEDVSIKEKAKAHFGNIIQVEKEGEMVSGTPTQATISKAQGYIDEGKIEDGVATLESLDGEAAMSVAPFLKKAQGTLLAEKVKSLLGESILSKATKPMEGAASGIKNIELPSVQPMSEMSVNDFKESLENVVPFVGGNEVVKDEESGVIIKSPSGAFKGFSSGQ